MNLSQKDALIHQMDIFKKTNELTTSKNQNVKSKETNILTTHSLLNCLNSRGKSQTRINGE